MSDLNTQRCDNPKCKKLRSEDANHWMHGHVLDGGGFALLPFGKELAMDHEVLMVKGADAHLCGQECATWWVQQQIGRMATTATARSRIGPPED